MSQQLRFIAALFVCAGTLGIACTPNADPAECVALEDEPEANAVGTTIELKNVGAIPFFIGEPGDRHDLIRVSVDGRMVIDEPGFPDLHCATIEDNFDSLCAEEPLTKDGERVVRIDPGASFTVEWDAYVWESLDLDADYSACIADPGCPTNLGLTCHAGRTVELGSTLSLVVGAAPSCVLPEGGDCECPPGESACEIPLPHDGTMLEGTEIIGMVELAYEGTAIVIELGG